MAWEGDLQERIDKAIRVCMQRGLAEARCAEVQSTYLVRWSVRHNAHEMMAWRCQYRWLAMSEGCMSIQEMMGLSARTGDVHEVWSSRVLGRKSDKPIFCKRLSLGLSRPSRGGMSRSDEARTTPPSEVISAATKTVV
jgi:hypothetical protein